MSGLMEVPAFAGMTFLRWDDGSFFRHTGAGQYLGVLAVCCEYFLGDFSLRSK